MQQSLVRTHPLIVGAALSIILCCLVAAAAITGVIPSAASQKGEAVDFPARTGESPAAPCAGCGTVLGVRTAQVSGSASGVGAVAGGVTGAVVGSQFGRGDGRTALAILGAAGGALAGNAIEKDMKKTTVWRVTVRMDDGTLRTVSQAEPPPFATGDKVRIVDGRVLALAAGERR